MTVRKSRKDLGDIVFDCLLYEPNLDEALERTGLTEAQWHSGLRYVKDVLAENGNQPVVYDAKTHRYFFPSLEKEVDVYIGRRINQFLIQLERLYSGTFVPAGIKLETAMMPNYKEIDATVQYLIKQLRNWRERINAPEPAAHVRRRKDREAAGLNHQ